MASVADLDKGYGKRDGRVCCRSCWTIWDAKVFWYWRVAATSALTGGSSILWTPFRSLHALAIGRASRNRGRGACPIWASSSDRTTPIRRAKFVAVARTIVSSILNHIHVCARRAMEVRIRNRRWRWGWKTTWDVRVFPCTIQIVWCQSLEVHEVIC